MTDASKKGCCSDCGYLTTNAAISGAIKTFNFDGVETMVVPVVAIVEGVLNGALVPNEEIEKFVAAWEGVPIPVHHPMINGHHVSSNIPQVLAARVIGRFHNVKAEGGKLKGEIWIDVNRAKEKGFGDIIETFEAGNIMEVSTAYFADTEDQSGIFNGKKYSGIHRNLRPDHLALLPNEIGACSVADGCGAMRANQQGKTMTIWEKLKSKLTELVSNEQSIEDRVTAVRSALRAAMGEEEYAYVLDVYDDHFVYEKDGKMWRRDYSINENAEAEIGEASSVRLEKSYVPTTNESDDEELEAQADDTESEDDELPNANGDEETETDEVQTMSKDTAQAPQLDAETLTAVNWAKNQYDSAKNRLISKLTANTACAFDEASLKAMHVNDLEKLDMSLSPRDYSGRGLPLETNQSDEEIPALEMPEPIVLKAVEGGAK